MEWTHILPNNDIQEHQEDSQCKCEPRVDIENELIIHNAYDGRELIEQTEKGELPE